MNKKMTALIIASLILAGSVCEARHITQQEKEIIRKEVKKELLKEAGKNSGRPQSQINEYCPNLNE